MSWTVATVMTSKVVSVQPTTPYKELVRLITEKGISALPVVDVTDAEGRLVGIVSEADLLLKQEHRGREPHPLTRPRGPEARARGRTAAALMSTPVITTHPEATLTEAARLMHQHGVKRLPVVDAHGRLVGIVSRADLLKAFLRSDESIRHELQTEILEPIGVTGSVRASVQDGLVTLEGEVESRLLAHLLSRLAQGVEGVIGVDSRLSYRRDDLDPEHLPRLLGTQAAHWSR
ncbi:MAG TPA: CBS domain-containing protein [Candidatus Dormibacteraeota bacterium]|nr:CBS domain-containing protein [Candidatus Dormibacteraeota bacterium]